MTTVPTAEEVAEALGASVALVGPALEAEALDQSARCSWPEDGYNAALREALIRRVARHLAMKNIPLGVQATELGALYASRTDPVVSQLEGPYRKRVVG